MVPGTAGVGLPDPAPGLPDPLLEPLPASDPPLEPAAEPDEPAPAPPLPVAPDDPEPVPEPDPGPDEPPGVGFPPLPGTVVVPPEELGAVIASPPPELEPPVLPAGEGPSPAVPEPAGEGLPAPEQAIGPRSANTGRNERRCRLVAVIMFSPSFESAARPRPPWKPIASISYHTMGGRTIDAQGSSAPWFVGRLQFNGHIKFGRLVASSNCLLKSCRSEYRTPARGSWTDNKKGGGRIQRLRELGILPTVGRLALVLASEEQGVDVRTARSRWCKLSLATPHGKSPPCGNDRSWCSRSTELLSAG